MKTTKRMFWMGEALVGKSELKKTKAGRPDCTFMNKSTRVSTTMKS